MGGERQERESLWGAQRRRPSAADDEHAGDVGASPKSQHVLDLQRQAGNAAVTGAVQRSLWGDDSWLGDAGSMFSQGGSTGPDTGKVTDGGGGAEPEMLGSTIDTGKVTGAGDQEPTYGGGAGGGDVGGGGYKEPEYKEPWKDPSGGGGGGFEEPEYKEPWKDPSGGGGDYKEPEYKEPWKDPSGGGEHKEPWKDPSGGADEEVGPKKDPFVKFGDTNDPYGEYSQDPSQFMKVTLGDEQGESGDSWW